MQPKLVSETKMLSNIKSLKMEEYCTMYCKPKYGLK